MNRLLPALGLATIVTAQTGGASKSKTRKWKSS